MKSSRECALERPRADELRAGAHSDLSGIHGTYRNNYTGDYRTTIDVRGKTRPDMRKEAPETRPDMRKRRDRTCVELGIERDRTCVRPDMRVWLDHIEPRDRTCVLAMRYDQFLQLAIPQ